MSIPSFLAMPLIVSPGCALYSSTVSGGCTKVEPPMEGPAEALTSGLPGCGGSLWKSMDQSVGSSRMLSAGDGNGSRASRTRITVVETNSRATADMMCRRMG